MYKIKNKILLLIGGNEKNIDIYYYNSFLKRIKNTHNRNINGLITLNNNSFGSYSKEIWNTNFIQHFLIM